MAAVQRRDIEAVLKARSYELMAIPGVKGVGLGDLKQRDVIVVFMQTANLFALQRIPQELEGYPVRTEVVGVAETL